ncbi:hypothetical protein ACVIW0_007588 [Bradyrhizobium sp. USDA 4454]
MLAGSNEPLYGPKEPPPVKNRAIADSWRGL